MSKKTTRKFKAEVSKVLSLVINSLYSNKEIFLRELISNASDALDKLQFEALTNSDVLTDDTELKIRVMADEEAGTLTVWDNGIGMGRDELIDLLGTVAHSGSRSFLEALEEKAKKGSDVNIIGQFGVGFYSSYLVADHVDVISKRAGSDEAFKWSSDAQEKFTVEPAEREARGTSVVLHLRDEHTEFLKPYKLRSLVKQYSDFVGHPIEMLEMSYEDDAEPEFEQVNQANALWRRNSSDITEEQYQEFYKHLSGDWEPSIAHTHFKVEGTQLFTGLLYIPSRPRFDLYNPEAEHGVRLFVKRVFIMDNAQELVPKWLRFVRGVIDSDDLPLNVSRELLQDSAVVRVIRKQIVRKTLDLLIELAEERPEDYAKVWENYGAVLKEGLHFEPQHSDKLSKLMRYASADHEEPISLDAYIDEMDDDQEHIYFAIGQSRSLLESSPHLETLKKRGFDILYLTDNIDQWAIEAIDEYEGKKLVDAIKDDLDLDAEEDSDEDTEELEPLTSKFQEILEDEVSQVRVSKRLADSPACLVVPEGGVASHIERLLREQNQNIPEQKRILEINPTHPLISAINELNKTNDSKVGEWVELIYDQALLAEGSPIKEPARFAKRFTGLMEEVAQARLN